MNFIGHNEQRKQMRKINSSPCCCCFRVGFRFHSISILCPRVHYFINIIISLLFLHLTEIVWIECDSAMKVQFFFHSCNSEWAAKSKTISAHSSNRDQFKWKMWWHFEKQNIKIIAIVIIKHVVCCRDLTDFFQL